MDYTEDDKANDLGSNAPEENISKKQKFNIFKRLKELSKIDVIRRCF